MDFPLSNFVVSVLDSLRNFEKNNFYVDRIKRKELAVDTQVDLLNSFNSVGLKKFCNNLQIIS